MNRQRSKDHQIQERREVKRWQHRRSPRHCQQGWHDQLRRTYTVRFRLRHASLREHAGVLPWHVQGALRQVNRPAESQCSVI